MLDAMARLRISTWASPLVWAAFPLRCPGCGVVAEPVCERCAGSLSVAPLVEPPNGIDEWFAPFAYDGVARELIARVKYRRTHAATTWLAARMAEIAEVPSGAVVTWAPTTRDRQRKRGFDHAEHLARRFAQCVGGPVRSILRREPGPPQTGRSAVARHRGPRFCPSRPAPVAVAVIDDVATTGATLRAAAAALRTAGAEHVVAVTAARTPRPW